MISVQELLHNERHDQTACIARCEPYSVCQTPPMDPVFIDHDQQGTPVYDPSSAVHDALEQLQLPDVRRKRCRDESQRTHQPSSP